MRNKRLNTRWVGLAAWICLLEIWGSCTQAAEPVETYRFGTAGIGDRLTNQFLLSNSGPEPMTVQSATPSCDCIQILQWPTNVEAGATGVVEVLFVPDKAGEVDYRVHVKTSVPDQPEIEYAVQGVVVAAAPRTRADRDWTLYLGTADAEKAMKDPSRAVWVDVRSAEAHARIRIPGSLHIPLYAVKTKGFLKDRPVVLVDEGYGSQVLEAECRKLREMGFSNLSIWYGGLNAWQRRGGLLEGEGGLAASRIPPIALRDIAYATDWLVVSADGATNRMEASVSIPLDVARQDEFVSALQFAIEARPQVAGVLIATQTGEDYRALSEIAGKIDAFVFYLEGGWAAWEAHLQMMGAIQHGRTAVARSTSLGSGGAPVRPGGCGGCPK